MNKIITKFPVDTGTENQKQQPEKVISLITETKQRQQELLGTITKKEQFTQTEIELAQAIEQKKVFNILNGQFGEWLEQGETEALAA